MDPTLLQSSPFDFAESKYLGQQRTFSNSSYSTNDFTFPSRRPQSSLTSGTAGVALPANPSLDFNGSSLLNETPYHQSSQLLLSPPDSTTGSASAGGNPTASANTFTTLPKPFPSNACAPDHFSTAPPSVLSSNWPGSSMTLMERQQRVPPLSPPHSYNSANGIGSTFRSMGERIPQYSSTLHTQISQGPFPGGIRYQSNPYPARSSPAFPFPVQEGSYPGHNMSTHCPENQNTTRQDGPPFHETTVLHPVLTLRNQRLLPEIMASIQKGFFQVDRKWTCYRRNYFAVQCSFGFRNGIVDGPFYLNRNGSEELIHQFAVSITAKTAMTSNGESEARGLVQHTPKRDKATESVPGRHPIAPSPNHAVGPNGTYPSAGHVYGGPNHLHPGIMGPFSGFENPGTNSIPTSHTFERIQFQKATANNGKRRAQQQYFLVVVELSANIGRQSDENWVVIATKESDPMVVRGRSPGHYKDNGRRDSQASMDPDRGTGHGSDGHAGPLSSGSYGHTHTSMDWMGSHRQGGHFGGSSYRHAPASRYSPASLVSSSTLAGTPTEVEVSLCDSRTAKSSCTVSSDRSALTPLSEGSDDIMFSSLDREGTGRKRPFEDDGEGEHMRFPLPGPFTDSMTSLVDFSATPYSKLLCASS
ncbi:uncharacterized protein PV07_04377 [Cladophialophora immunda]|uniref:NDT80 domain-containing protein n=1 Tax=Cladophialophora immunda TaxID=569365 RepID=A0A0D2CNM6_9EURO|nr:uncharacterized protein PV07_04377 [Cladophialophora immunda]KIW32863.1 hypothetical protein PV07_04377 [Cladophialophora immunda]